MAPGIMILVNCPDCSQVRVEPSDVTLRNCVDDQSWSYRFTCPHCDRLAVAETEGEAALGAVAAGALLERWHLPAELREQHDGPPLEPDDVLSFHELLLEPRWFEALVQRGEDDPTR